MRNTMNTTSTNLVTTRTTAMGSLCSLRSVTVGMSWCTQITLSKGEDLI